MAYINFLDPTSLASTSSPPPHLPPYVDVGIDPRSLASQIPLDNGLVISSAPTASFSSGMLGKCPAEINSLLIEHLDIASIMNMRRVNMVWRATVSSTTLYRTLTTADNLPLLRLLVATHTATAVTIPDFLALRTGTNRKCHFCKAPGALFDILALSHSCQTCFGTYGEQPAPLALVKKACGLSEKQIRRRVVVLDTITGSYAPAHVAGRRYRREQVMSLVAARALCGMKVARTVLVRRGRHMKQVNMVVARTVGL